MACKEQEIPEKPEIPRDPEDGLLYVAVNVPKRKATCKIRVARDA